LKLCLRLRGPHDLSTSLNIAVGFSEFHGRQVAEKAKTPIEFGLNQPFSRSRYEACFAIDLRCRHARIERFKFIELKVENLLTVGINHSPLPISPDACTPLRKVPDFFVFWLYQKGAGAVNEAPIAVDSNAGNSVTKAFRSWAFKYRWDFQLSGAIN
jgi:hypothetical protein